MFIVMIIAYHSRYVKFSQSQLKNKLNKRQFRFSETDVLICYLKIPEVIIAKASK